MNASGLLLIATLLPLSSFVGLIFFGRKLGVASAYIATAAILGALILSVASLATWYGNTATSAGGGPKIEVTSVVWIPLADSAPKAALPGTEAAPAIARPAIRAGILVDSLTLVMFTMVCTVALLVHIFSIAYMAGDSRYSRFFAYLGLFCFSMLGLLLSNNLIQLFVFWELVGICSYLLIGFWFEKRGPASACRKAVLTNRVGDVTFVLGMGILVAYCGVEGLTLFNAQGQSVMAQSIEAVARTQAMSPENSSINVQFATMATPFHAHLTDNLGPAFLGISWLTWAGLLLFGGAVAKSAQFPLHVWLPDAMEGPTPVSALIHAATMVAAGVYLVARLFPILTLDVRMVIAVIGCITLAMGALTAIVQTDLKRVLAYSTISQLGFMMLFLGCGGYVAGMFHLITHAFFKACLFLGAGSVIHAMHHEQDMRQMGGLWKKIPLTAGTFLVAVAAIAGTPFTSGYYSKDLGLATVWQFATHQLGGGWGMLLFYIPVATAYLTAFYMMRAWWLTFAGTPRNEEKYDHAHESPTMTLPLLVLATLALIGGSGGIICTLIAKSVPQAADLPRHLFTEGQWLSAFEQGQTEVNHVLHHAEAAATSAVWWAFIVGPLVAIALYFRGFVVEDFLRRIPGFNLIHSWLYQRMFFDYLYEGIVIGIMKIIIWTAGKFDKYVVDMLVNLVGLLTRAGSYLSGIVDNDIVDGAVNGAAEMAQAGGRAVLAPQTGRIRFYMLSMLTLVGAVAVALAIVFMNRA